MDTTGTSSGCAVCGATESKKGGKLKKCHKCEKVFYCCKEHFLQDRPAHKMACKADDGGMKAIHGIDYTKVDTAVPMDVRFLRANAVRSAKDNIGEAAASGEGAAPTSTIDALHRMEAGLEQRTIRDKIDDPNRLTWDEFKQINKDKLDIGNQDKAKMAEYRETLDRERAAALQRGVNRNSKGASAEESKEGLEEMIEKEKEKLRKKKDKKKKSKKSKKKSKKRKRESSSEESDASDGSGSSSESEDESSDSDSSDEEAKKKRKKKDKKKKSKKSKKSKKKKRKKEKEVEDEDEPVKLSSFFSGNYDSGEDGM